MKIESVDVNGTVFLVVKIELSRPNVPVGELQALLDEVDGAETLEDVRALGGALEVTDCDHEFVIVGPEGIEEDMWCDAAGALASLQTVADELDGSAE